MGSQNQFFDSNDVKKMKGLIMLHINIRSLLPKMSLFTHNLLDEKLDIVLVSESWLKKGLDDNLFIVPGYHFIRKDRPTLKRGGGLCIYLKDFLDVARSRRGERGPNRRPEGAGVKVQECGE